MDESATTDDADLPDAGEPDPLTPKRRALVEAMVWKGLPAAAAAREAGMSERNARFCVRDPRFRAALEREIAVLRASHRPRNIHRLAELRDQNEAKGAAVQAARTLEDMAKEDEARPSATHIRPGIVVVITRETKPTEGEAKPAAGVIVYRDAPGEVE